MPSRIRGLTAVCLCALLAGCGRASVRSSPEISVGEVGARLDDYLSRVANFGFAGSVLIADSSQVLLSHGYGLANEARNQPNTASTIFDMGSIVKQFTAAGILLLESEGKLRTTDSIARFFPEAPADKAAITLHQVMTHTSGIVGDVAGDYDAVGRDSALKVIWASPLVSVPGKQFEYSNAGYSLLGALIERITGKPYEQFLRARLLDPAGMHETGYRLTNLDSSRVAHTYTPPTDHGTPAERLATSRGPWWNLMANGGMLTTVTDLYKYELALRRGTPVSKVIQAKQFAEQLRRSPTLANGYDWWIEPAADGGIQYNRGGDASQYGLNAEWRRYPKDHSTFIVLSNNRHHGWSSRRYILPNLRMVYLGSAGLTPPWVARAEGAQLAPLAGVYRIDSGSYIRIDTSRGRLTLGATGQSAVNVLVFNRDSGSMRNRDRINDRALAGVKALAMRDSAGSVNFLGSALRASELTRTWKGVESRLGAFRCASVLGSDRLDRGVFLTTVRLRFADTTLTVRFTWTSAGPEVNVDDDEQRKTVGFAADSPVDVAAWSPYWYLSGDAIVTYDMNTNQTLRGRRVGNDLVFELPGREVRATKVARIVETNEWCRDR